MDTVNHKNKVYQVGKLYVSDGDIVVLNGVDSGGQFSISYMGQTAGYNVEILGLLKIEAGTIEDMPIQINNGDCVFVRYFDGEFEQTSYATARDGKFFAGKFELSVTKVMHKMTRE